MSSSNKRKRQSITVMLVSLFLFIGALSYAQTQIRTVDDLMNISRELGGNFIQVADIDMQDVRNWTPLGDERGPFTGVYDGGGFKISNLTITEGTTDIGLFGVTGQAAQIRNLALHNIIINRPNANNVGAMVGRMLGRSQVSQCYAVVEITANTGGGLVGNLAVEAVIINSYTAGELTTEMSGGGLLGINNRGAVTNSYSVVSVNAGRVNGGLIGQGGLQGNITDSYWDTQVSGLNESQGGTGMTTAAMLVERNYNRWNFDPRDGIWFSGHENDDTYPWLQWQQTPGNHNYPPGGGLPGPRNLEATPGDAIVDLRWDAPAEGEVQGYRVYRDNIHIGSTNANIRNYRAEGLTNGTEYSFFITAMIVVEEELVESAPSNTVRSTPVIGLEGEGTEENPYLISSADHLVALREFAGDEFAGVHFRQTANIDLEAIASWQPISPFRGIYDGRGFEIRNLTITGEDHIIGLFGVAREGAQFHNIHIVDADINGGARVGVLVGQVLQSSTITGCSATGRITSNSWNVGGLVGEFSQFSHITDSWADVEITGNGFRWGGLLGTANSTGTIARSFAIGNVTSSTTQASAILGGFAGQFSSNGGSIVNCYAIGNVTSTEDKNNVGGFLGTIAPASIVRNNYSTGIVTSGGTNIGGFLGTGNPAAGNWTNNYWNTETSMRLTSAGGVGVEGLNTRQMLDSDSFNDWDFDNIWRQDEASFPYLRWEGDTAGNHVMPPLNLPPTNLTAAAGEDTITLIWNEPQMLQPDGYKVYRNDELISGDELVAETRYVDEEVELWTPYFYTVKAVYTINEQPIESIHSQQVYAVLHNYEAGDGTEDDPFTVATVSQLKGVALLLGSHFIQTGDIDLEGIDWEPLGNFVNRFTGSYDGDSRRIMNLTIETDEAYGGLFGYSQGALLQNIRLVDANITAGSFVGALIGRSDNTAISFCSASGSVTGTDNVGGMIGRTLNTSALYPVNDSYSTAAVTATTGNHAGGLIGDNWGTINRCYATGNVNGVDFVGGLCGYDTNQTLNHSFATGNVSGRNNVGGLLGRLRSSNLYDSYATGNVTGNSNAGGLIGTNAFHVYRCYSIGLVTGEQLTGGLIGASDGATVSVTNSYWNTESSQQEQSAGGLGRDGHAMTHPYAADTYEEWDFNTVWTADEEHFNGGYPYLFYQSFTPPETPVVNISIVFRDEESFIRLEWEGIDDALSYKIYASLNPYIPFEEWDEIVQVEDEWYEERIDPEDNRYMFYRVTASGETP